MRYIGEQEWKSCVGIPMLQKMACYRIMVKRDRYIVYDYMLRS